MDIYDDNIFTILDTGLVERSPSELIKLLKSYQLSSDCRVVDYDLSFEKNNYVMVTDELLTIPDALKLFSQLGFNIARKFIGYVKIVCFTPRNNIEHNGFNEMIGYRLESPNTQIPKKIKEYIYSRDGGKCVVCGKKLKKGDDDMTIDHIVPRELGGSSLDTRNLQLMCKHCNKTKGSKLISNSELRKLV